MTQLFLPEKVITCIKKKKQTHNCKTIRFTQNLKNLNDELSKKISKYVAFNTSVVMKHFFR